MKSAYLVWGRIFAEADITVNAKYDVFGGQFGYGLVDFNKCLCCRFDKRLPILQRSSVLSIVCCGNLHQST